MQNMKKLGLWALQWLTAAILLAVLAACGAQPEPAAKLPQPIVNQTSTFTVSANGLTVTFDASAFSGTQTAAPASFQWNFGDGTLVQNTTSVTITHVYAASGTYVVNLVVLDAQGVAGKVISQNVTVAPLPVTQAAPIARFALATNGLSVGVDASLSSDPDGTITTYVWNFGDPNSNANTASGQTATHTYGATGAYTVTLVVTDNTGLTATSQQQANVVGVPNVNPIANFIFTRDALLANFFGGASTDPDGTITDYSWNFGEPNSTSNTATGATPTHAYRFAGSYTVTLTVTDNQGATGVLTSVVTVSPPAAIATGVLNDTGVTAAQCYQLGSDTLVACNSAAAIATVTLSITTFAPQDGMVGRDTEPGSNIATDGDLGFSFTKIGVSGEVLPANAPQWSCIRDNVTGLMWENKTFSNAGTGLRDVTKKFTNYDSTTANQLPTGGAPSQAQIDALTNSIGYKNAVNNEALCGATDWRIPESGEMLSIFNHNNQQAQGLDSAWFSSYFGATSSYLFISASASKGLSDAEYVAYSNGGNLALSRSGTSNLHLVRGAPKTVISLRFEQFQPDQVFDNKTGLIWRACAEGMSFDVNNCFGTPSELTHEEALNYVAQVGNGWRLPNAKELESIVDRSFINLNTGIAAIDSTAFPSTPPKGFWSSTPSEPYAAQPTGQVNIVYFDSGFSNVVSRTIANKLYVRLVRNNSPG